jgi:hypothetical protein
MFRDLIISWPMALWGWLPLFFCFLVFVVQCVKWSRRLTPAKGQTRILMTFETSNFQESINGALTVSGVIVPLLCAAVAYFSLSTGSPRELVPLLASTMLFIVSVLVGLLNLCALPTVATDKLEITKEENGGFVPQFVAQLWLMAAGMIVLLVYFFGFFDPPRPEPATPPVAAVVLVQRPMVQAGMKAEEVKSAWGEPIAGGTDAATHWRYRTQNSEIVLELENGVVKAVTQRLVP